jgi:hypothetical protein
VGASVGLLVGLGVDIVGESVSVAVGWLEGAAVGNVVVGYFVGDAVVGIAVGAVVGPASTQRKNP